MHKKIAPEKKVAPFKEISLKLDTQTFGKQLEGFKTLAFENVQKTANMARMAGLNRRGLITDSTLEQVMTGKATFEKVIGTPDFLPSCFLEQGYKLASAICKIEASGIDLDGEHGAWYGTGFMVSENILLTNNHVLNSIDVAFEARAVFNYEKDLDGELKPTKSFTLRPERLFLTSSAKTGLDYTFVWVDGAPGKTFGYIPLSRSAFKAANGEAVNIIQHPAGNPKAVVLQKNELVAQDVVVMHYKSDTEPGSSGGPAFNNDWRLIALHHASQTIKDQAGKNVEVNEGIKLSAIAAELEKTKQSTEHKDAASEILKLFGSSDALLGFFGALGRANTESEMYHKDGKPATSYEKLVPTYQGEHKDIDVGGWNIEWFATRYKEKTPDVARVIVAMNLDIWAFSETSPEATAYLVKYLKDNYGQTFAYLASEPQASSNLQTTTVMWNTKTVDGEALDWGSEIDAWLSVDSRNFDGLNLEAVHGKVFPRYPGLFKFKAKQRTPLAGFDFCLIPLHLKAMDEGSLRRSMASRILAKAIESKSTELNEPDFIVLGDFNAELATGDFQDLVNSMVPLSATDEANGTFTYLKGPKSLIDHVFLSQNLAKTYGEDDYFILAADKQFPDFVTKMSDHAPVIFRMSLKDRQAPERLSDTELFKALQAATKSQKPALAGKSPQKPFK